MILDFNFKLIQQVFNLNCLPQPTEVVCLGWPDFVVSEELMSELYGKKANKFRIENNPRQWDRIYGEFFDVHAVFQYHNCNLTIIDLVKHRGVEEFLDLNEPLDEKFFQKFDLVIDTGTLEHCFNVGTAFKNMCNMTKKGGIIITAAPYSRPFHGYYNFTKGLYTDGFEKNGFEILEFICTTSKKMRVMPEEEFFSKIMPGQGILNCIAKKIEDKEFKWPVQGKYEG
jgi:hypothetical protein